MEKTDFRKIKKILQWAYHSPYSDFYRKKYRQVNFNPDQINSWEDFDKIPILEKAELLSVNPGKRVFTKPNNINHSIITSGTTTYAKPLIFLLSESSYKVLDPVFSDSVKNTHSTLILMSPFHLMNASKTWFYPSLKGRILNGDIQNLELTADLSQATDIDSIFTSPTMLYHFLPELEKKYDLNRIKLVIFRGEYCSEIKLAYFQQKLTQAKFEFHYGTVETMRLGYRCQYLSKKAPRFYHPSPFYLFELQNDAELNRLIVTSLSPYGPMPLIRYFIGDVVNLITQNCKCGAKQSLEVLGRLDNDLVKFSGITLYSFLIEQALLNFSEQIKVEEFQVHIYERESLGKLINHLKLQLIPIKNTQLATLKKQLENDIPTQLYLSSKTTLAEVIRQGLFSFEIEFSESIPKTFKTKRLVSHIN